MMNPLYNDGIGALLAQVGAERILLPNATVAEVMARVAVEPLPAAAPWLLGQIGWHGWKLPLLSLARLSGLGEECLSSNNRVIVLKALSEQPPLPYYAVLTGSFPQLIAVPRDSLLADASEQPLPPAIHMRVLIGEQSALLPDLDAVEASLRQALPAPA